MKQPFLSCCISLLVMMYTNSLYSQQFMMPTEEELIKMNQEIEAFRSSMTEEQRNEFDKQVQELSKVMENMSEDELNKFIETVFSQENPDLITPPTPDLAPTATLAPLIKPEEPLYKPSSVSAKNKEAAQQILISLIKQIESFLRKSALVPDLYGSLDSWVPVAIRAGKTELTWHALKQDIERLISALKTLLTTDPATGHYYYLASLIENDALYQMIVRLHETLMRQESKITVTAFGVQEINKESRKAIEAILSSFVQTLYTQQLMQEIQKLFAGFAPEAKKVMEQEESARKRAIEESKRKATPAPMLLGGTLYDDVSYAPGSSAPLYDTGGGYLPPAISVPSYGQQAPTYERPESLPPKKTGETLPSTPPTTPKEESDKKKKAAEAAPVKTDSAEKIIEKIETFLEDCIIAIKAKKLSETVMDPSNQEVVSEIAGKIARIISRIKTLESVMKDYTPAQKNMYLDRIKIMVKDEKDLFDTLLSATESDKNNELRKQIEALFKKLDLVHTKKTIKPKTVKPSVATKTPTAQELAQMNKEIETIRSSLPAKQQKEFDEQVKELTAPVEVHPASLPSGVTDSTAVDIHPAAFRARE